jgi:hypothetical protein
MQPNGDPQRPSWELPEALWQRMVPLIPMSSLEALPQHRRQFCPARSLLVCKSPEILSIVSQKNDRQYYHYLKSNCRQIVHCEDGSNPLPRGS